MAHPNKIASLYNESILSAIYVGSYYLIHIDSSDLAAVALVAFFVAFFASFVAFSASNL